MKKELKIKVLITLLLVLTISFISTDSNAALKFNNDLFTDLTTKITESFNQVITKTKEVFVKLKEGFDIGLERTDTGIKINLGLIYNDASSFFDITTGNAGVVEFDLSTMSLTVAGLGETVVNIKIGEKVIPINVKVDSGGIQIKPQGLGVTVNGELVGNFKLSEKEIANIEAEMGAEGGMSGVGVSGGVTSTQKLTLLQKITLNFSETASGKVDMSGASGSVGGQAAIGDSIGVHGEAGGGVNLSGVAGEAGGGVNMNGGEIVGGTAGLGYTFGAADPVASVSGRLLGNNIFNLQNITIPISKAIAGLKTMLLGLPF